MSEADLIHYTSQSLVLVLLLSLPVISVAALVGLLVGLFQALTQIQDQTFSFVFKLVGVIITLIVSAGWLGGELHSFAIKMFEAITLLETRVLAQRPDDQLARCFLGWAYDMSGQRSTSDGLFDQVRHNGSVSDIALAESLLTQREQPIHQ